MLEQLTFLLDFDFLLAISCCLILLALPNYLFCNFGEHQKLRKLFYSQCLSQYADFVAEYSISHQYFYLHLVLQNSKTYHESFSRELAGQFIPIHISDIVFLYH